DAMIAASSPEVVIRHAGVYEVAEHTEWNGDGLGGVRLQQLLICPPGSATDQCSSEDITAEPDNAVWTLGSDVDLLRLDAGQRLRVALSQNGGHTIGEVTGLEAVWLGP